MTPLLVIVIWVIIGGAIAGFVAGRNEMLDGDADAAYVLVAVMAIFWPFTLLGMIAYYPARWAYRLGSR